MKLGNFLDSSDLSEMVMLTFWLSSLLLGHLNFLDQPAGWTLVLRNVPREKDFYKQWHQSL